MRVFFSIGNALILILSISCSCLSLSPSLPLSIELQYADPVADLLDKYNTFSGRLFRESCVFHKGNYVKVRRNHHILYSHQSESKQISLCNFASFAYIHVLTLYTP